MCLPVANNVTVHDYWLCFVFVHSSERAQRSRQHERGTSAERRYKRSNRRSPTSGYHSYHHRHHHRSSNRRHNRDEHAVTSAKRKSHDTQAESPVPVSYKEYVPRRESVDDYYQSKPKSTTTTHHRTTAVVQQTTTNNNRTSSTVAPQIRHVSNHLKIYRAFLIQS